METQTALTTPAVNLAAQPPVGLTSAEVAERIARGESNTVRQRFERTYWQIVRDNVFNLFNLVLFALVLVLLAFHDYSSIVFGTFSVVANSLIGTFQEIRAKRALDRLAALTSPDVAVWRDGRREQIAIEAVVKDDILPIEPGDRLCVDGVIVRSDSLELDESLLSGEADAISKEEAAPVYSGSYVVAGAGLMRATQVGAASTINKLSTVAKAYRNVKTPTQMKIDTLVAIAMVVIVIFAPMLIISGLNNRLAPVETVRNTLVLVTSLVPQGLMLSTTVSLALSAVRLSRRQALVQRVNAVESLANTTVVCFDKTGTLTLNEMAVVELVPLNGQSVDELRAQLGRYTRSLAHLNTTAAAIRAYVALEPASTPAAPKQSEIPFSSFRKWGAVAFADGALLLGAPERVIGQDASGVERARCLAAQGLRVLALAEMDGLPDANQQVVTGRPLALIVLSDQVRDGIGETLRQFGAQAVGVKVISGDNLETVAAIAAQAGIPTTAMYTGRQLDQMSEGELEKAAQQGTVFARIEPATKRRIVAALKRGGAYVAMVGDGVNDVPALKEAHLAIAMQGGAQVARDVADIVLLNNAISTLPPALVEGKKITQKIYATTRIYLPKTVYQLLLFILAGYMALPFPIGPIQISWFGLLLVSTPTVLIAFDLIRPAPVRSFNKEILGYTAVSGVIGAIGMACLYAMVYLGADRDPTLARSAVLLFMALFGAIIFLNSQGVDLFRVRTLRRHRMSTGLGILLAIITIGVPLARPGLFQIAAPTTLVWLLLFGVFAATAAALELTLHNRAILSRLRQLSSA